MRYDIFCSLFQVRVNDHKPDEKTMFQNFFEQARLADELGFETCWVAETHLSTEVQKQNKRPVVPHMDGEIGLNTDILQLSQKVFSQTKNMNMGSAIKNILCNGGPIANAEAIRTFLTLHGMDPEEKRRLNIGFASGRFEFSNRPYGVLPRNAWEEAAWPVMKGKWLNQATEIFLRLLKGEQIGSEDLRPQVLLKSEFRGEDMWQKTVEAYGKDVDEIPLEPFYNFEKIGVIPFEAPMHLLDLTIGTHDERIQKMANEILPVGVFNLSITPPEIIEKTHQRMAEQFHKDGGPWTRSHMPRTAMVFLNEDSNLAKEQAKGAWQNYWNAMEGTIDNQKVEQAVHNALVGTPEEITAQIKEKYHPDDRLMLWFDFNNHDNDAILKSMEMFMKQVKPELESM
ncbi:MAG: LLM class flavin-dependent oxidoreductase [Bdellovibrionales bacterium]|nr:LLM class flavin-dependent oxidoreductase [Bdellovibrionales bacterium]